AVLGQRRGRVLPRGPGDRGALRPLVPARRVHPDLPLARLGVARARAVGARRAGGGDLPRVRGAALPSAPLHLLARLAGVLGGAAPDAPAGAELSRRPAGLAARPPVPLG